MAVSDIDIFIKKTCRYSGKKQHFAHIHLFKLLIMAENKAVSDVVEGATVKESLGRVADSIVNVFTPASDDTAAEVKDESVSNSVAEAALVIKDSLKDTISDDRFLGGLALGIAVGAFSHYIYNEHGEAIGDGVCSLGVGVAEGIGAGVSKIKGLFTPRKKKSKTVAFSPSGNNTFTLEIPPDLRETAHRHDRELRKYIMERIKEYKLQDEREATTTKSKVEPKN